MNAALMNAGLQLRDALGVRRLERSDFPLSIGGPGSVLCVDASAAAGETIAWLGLHEDGLFLQPVLSGRLHYNGAPLERTTWLHTGDVVTADTAVLRLQLESGNRTLVLEDGATGNATAPPVVENRELKSGGAEDAPEALVRVAYHARVHAERTAGAQPRQWRGPLLLGTMVLAIITVFWLLATGVAVQLQVTPAQAQLDVTGSWLTPRIGEQLFLRPGRYVLHAQLPGYAVRELPFEVTGKTGQSLKLALDKLPGKLQVTVPASGTLRLSGGEPLAVPAVLNVSAGHHPVEINVPGYLPWSGEIEIQGEGRAQTLAPTLLPNSAIVNVSSTPAGAALLLRGIAAGTTPFSRELPAGSYALELRMPGFRPWTTDVLVKAGVPQTIGPVQLGLPDATLMVRSTPANARIMVGGVYRGQTPLRLTLRAATETAISLTSPGYEEAQRSVRLGPATGSDLAVELTPILGSVQIRTEPADAEVWIDGTLRGKGSQTLQLPAIAHKLEVRRAGYQGFNAEFTPRPAFEQVVDAQLHTEAEQQQARMPATLRAAGSMDLRLIPAGRYIMGSARREAGRRANEGQRPVELRRRFYLGVHEVTNAEFRRYRPEHKSGVFATVSLNLDNQPAVQLTWQDAAAYCNWLSQQDGLPAAYEANNGELTAVKPMNTGYRLPSEAEWEWAARYSRGVAALRYPWGDALPVPANSGNYADVTARTPLQEVIEGYQDGFLASAPVGSYTPSELGVYDLGGNVSEWTVDVYATSFSVAAEALDPMYLATGTQHSVRGASWRTATSADLRTAARAAANAPRDDLGFRVARYAE